MGRIRPLAGSQSHKIHTGLLARLRRTNSPSPSLQPHLPGPAPWLGGQPHWVLSVGSSSARSFPASGPLHMPFPPCERPFQALLKYLLTWTFPDYSSPRSGFPLELPSIKQKSDSRNTAKFQWKYSTWSVWYFKSEQRMQCSINDIGINYVSTWGENDLDLIPYTGIYFSWKGCSNV